MAAGVLPLARGQCRQENRQARSPESRRVVSCRAVPAACSPICRRVWYGTAAHRCARL